MYLYELVNWLTTVVDSLQISEEYKDEAYRAATAYIAQCLMVSLSFNSEFPTPKREELEKGAGLRLTRYGYTVGLPRGSKHREDKRKRNSEHPRRP